MSSLKRLFRRKQMWYLLSEVIRKPFYLWYVKRRAKIGKNPKIFGKPLIINYGKIEMGDECALVSSPQFYGSDLGPVSLYTIHEGSEITIGNRCTLQGTSVRCAERVSIGNNVVFASGVKIIDHDHHVSLAKRNSREYPSKPVVIEDEVWFGFDVTVLKGVRIGRGSIIGASSVVVHDVPPMSIATGIPAKVVGEIR